MNKLELVERAIFESVKKNPQNEVIITPEWVQVTSPNIPSPFVNGVYRCELSADLIEERVINVINHYKKLNIPFRWKVSPSTKPLGIAALLTKHGLGLKDELFGLIAIKGQVAVSTNPEVRISTLSQKNLEDWLIIQAKAWHVPAPGITHLRKDMSEKLLKVNEHKRDYIAYIGQIPVASAGLQFHDGYAFLVGAAVRPEFRKKGVYQTILKHRLDLIFEKNLPAVIHCLKNTSAPICLKLGFEKVCDIFSYEP